MIIKKFEEQVEKYPHNKAVVTDVVTLTYEDLNRHANRGAREIERIADRADAAPNQCSDKNIAALLFEHSADMIVGVLAALKADKIYVPLDINYPENRLIYMLEDSGAFLLATNNNNLALAEKLKAEVKKNNQLHDIEILNIDSLVGNLSTENIERRAAGDKLAYILYTSGSTGKPKGVVQNHANIDYYIRNWTSRFTINAHDRMTLFSAFSHDGAGQDMFGALMNGAVLYPYNILNRANIGHLARWLIDEKITIWHSVPTLFRYFVNTLDKKNLPEFPELRFILLGGEQLRRHDIELAGEFFPNTTLVNVYGQTESSVDAVWMLRPGAPFEQILVGQPLDRTKIFLVDKNDEIVEEIGVGEIVVACKHIALGYWKDPQNTEKVFTEDPELGRLYFTGDQGRLLSDGGIEFMGRKDSQVKIRGFRVEMGEIETLLLQHRAVKEAVVLSRENEDHNIHLCAYLVLNHPASGNGETFHFTVSDMREYLAGELPEYMIPSYLVQLDELPLTPNGKIDRKRLPAPESLRPRLETVYAAPRNDVEIKISRLWQEVLKLDKVGLDDNFFDLGGTSFDILKIMSRLYEEFKRDVPVVSIFRYPTIRAFVEYLKQQQEEGSALAPVRLPARKRARLVPGQEANGKQQPIAVIGMAGKFPGARNLEDFWDNLCRGIESISFFSSDELIKQGVAPELLQHPDYVNAFGVLEEVEYFDGRFFGYSPGEARMMDPQLRLLHEYSWLALEDAGYDPDNYDGLIGLYTGNAPNQYWVALTYFQQKSALDTAFLHNNYSTRVSYKLNLQGPSYIVQTACSTALSAIHLACRGLIDRECDIAIAGAVSISLPDREGYLYSEGMILSPDGHCRAFDAQAGGTVFGNGVGMVVLKRLEDAVAESDSIQAVIKGSAVNNDGSRKVGVTAPSVLGQAEVIRAAQESAGVHPETITYIEAHGTGTGLGDPVEIEALKLAFGVDKKGYCAVGSVKANVGHLNSAAGVIGVIKVVLALKHRLLPPSLFYEKRNPAIDFGDSPFYVVTKTTEWKPQSEGAAAGRLRAGVSSFGIGGTNAHVILEEWRDPASAKVFGGVGTFLQKGSDPPEAKSLLTAPWLFLLSARTQSALEQMTKNLARFFEKNPAINLADAAYTLQVGRKAFRYRAAATCSSAAEAIKKLTDGASGGLEYYVHGDTDARVVFMFPGQGSQYVDMCRRLYETEPRFRAEMDDCFAILQPLMGVDLKEILYPQDLEGARAAGPPAPPAKAFVETVAGGGAPVIDQTRIAQPLIFAIEYSLAKLLMSWGIMPYAMIGHSIGEFTAACLAGVFSLAEALRLVALRGRLMQQMPPGDMLSVILPEAELRALLDRANPGLSIAAVNSPQHCVVSGPPQEIEAFVQRLTRAGHKSRKLHTSHAFHSRMMEPILNEFAAEAGKTAMNKPKIPYISNVTGTWISVDDAVDAGYWARHIRETVRFNDGVTELLKEKNPIFVEIGPGQSLSTFIRQRRQQKPDMQVIDLVRAPNQEADDSRYLVERLGRLWLYGVKIDWLRFHGNSEQPAGRQRRRINLPTYFFERERYWLEGNPLKIIQRDSQQFLQSQAELTSGLADEQEKTAAYTAPKYNRPELSTPYQAPTTPLEQTLVGIWQDLLDIGRVGVLDDFFELGGDSLKAANFSACIRKATDVEVPVAEFFSYPTIEQLARYIDENRQNQTNKYAAINPVEEKEYYDLSIPQRRIFILQAMEPRSIGYNITSVVQLLGEVDRARFEDAIAGVIERHESFRTHFKLLASQPVQMILPNRDVVFPVEYFDLNTKAVDNVDMSPSAVGESPGITSARIDDVIRTFIRPFDLSQAPLLRVGLLRLEKTKHVLLIDVHHLVCDGTSTLLFFSDFIEAYHGRKFSPQAVRYRDYSHWLSKPEIAAVKKKQEQAWLQWFADEIPIIDLFYDYPRPAVQSFVGKRIVFELEEAGAQALKAAAKAEEATIFMIILALYNVLLMKLSSQEDIVVGTPAAGRRYAGLDSIIGMFVNTLALRNYPAGQMTFREFLAQVKQRSLAAFENQEYPFEELVEKSAVRRDLSRNPLFDVMFRMLNYSLPSSGLRRPGIEGLTIAEYEYENRPAIVDLQLTAIEADEKILFILDYSIKLFKEETIERFIGYFKKIIHSFPHLLERRLAAVEIMSPQEKEELLYRFNDTAVEYPAHKMIHRLFAEQVEKTPDNTALVILEQEDTHNESKKIILTYRELDREADNLAELLTRKGLQTGDVAALMLERSFLMMIGIFAILKAGAGYLPISPQYPENRTAFILQDSAAKLLLTTHSLVERFEKLKNLAVEPVYVEEWMSEFMGSPAVETYRETPADRDNKGDSIPGLPASNLAYIIYTSGSTGNPKGAMIEHHAVVNRLNWMQKAYPLDCRDVILQKTTYTFDVSVWELFWWSFHGAVLGLLAPGAEKDPGAIIDAVDIYKISTMHFVPSMLNAFLNYLESTDKSLPKLKSLRQVFASGEALSSTQVKQFYRLFGRIDHEAGISCRLINLYGPTEATVDVSYFDCPDLDENERVPIGKPIDNIQLYILDQGLHPQPIGVPGQLHIAGVGLARGYLNNPELTADKFVFNNKLYKPHKSYKTYSLQKIYRTGDLARWLPDGNIEFLGRIDHQVKISGFRIELEEIENQLRTHHKVKDAVVTSKERDGNRYLWAFIAADETVTAPGLREYLSGRLPDYMIPSYFVQIEKVPLTANGKVDKRALDKIGVRLTGAAANKEAPRNAIEERIAAAWKEVLHLDSVGIHDNYFELGGNSLDIIRLNMRLQESFYIEIPVVAMFRYTTIHSLAGYLSGEETAVRERETAVKRGKESIKALRERKGGKVTKEKK